MRAFLPLLLLTISLTACGLFNDRYEQPQVAAPAQFAEADAAAPDAGIERDWWVNFGSEPLNALVGQALRENLDISAAIARIRQADAQTRIAGSPLLPSIGLTGDGTRTKSSNGRGTSVSGLNGTSVGGTNGTTVNGSNGGTTGAGTIVSSGGKPRNSFSGRLQASYEIDFWGRNAAALASAEASRAASEYDRETVTLAVAGNVVNTYFAILGLRDRVTIAEDNLRSAEGLLEAINKRASVGLVSALDTAQQENLVATQRTVLPGLRLQLRQNLDALAILVGQLPEALRVDVPQANALQAVAVPAVAPGLPSTLLARRPDVANAEAQLIAANADINQARAALFPAITLTGSFGYASDVLGQLVRGANELWSVGAGLSQTIFDNGLLFGQLDLNKAREEELLANYRKVAISAFADTEDALAAVRETAAQEDGQREAMRTAQLAYDLSQRQFQAGITDITTTLNTQRALFSAQDTFIQARLAHLQAVVSLYQALGGGWLNDSLQSG